MKNKKKYPPLRVLRENETEIKKSKSPFLFIVVIIVLGVMAWFLFARIQNLNITIITAQPAFFALEPDNFAKTTKLIPINTTFANAKDAGDWYEIKYENEVGYVSKGYMISYQINGNEAKATYRDVSTATWKKDNKEIIEQQSTYKIKGKEKSLAVTDELKLRDTPSTSSTSNVLLTIPKGQSPMYISNLGDWYRVFYGGTVGYIYGGYIDVTDIEPEPNK